MGWDDGYVIYADTRGGCQSIRTMLERSGANGELHCFHEKDGLRSYLLEKKAENGRADHDGPLLFYKLLIDDLPNVSFARQICDHYGHLPVVFVMDHICYVYMLFDAERQYYLWPPFSKERVTKAIEQLSARKSRPHAPAMSIVVSGRAGDLVLPADDIIYCESEKRITYFYTADEKSKMYVKLSDVEEMLAGRFIRCHQSFLVNFSYIKRVGKADIELTNGKFIPISQRKRSKVLAAIEALGRGEMS